MEHQFLLPGLTNDLRTLQLRRCGVIVEIKGPGVQLLGAGACGGNGKGIPPFGNFPATAVQSAEGRRIGEEGLRIRHNTGAYKVVGLLYLVEDVLLHNSSRILLSNRIGHLLGVAQHTGHRAQLRKNLSHAICRNDIFVRVDAVGSVKCVLSQVVIPIAGTVNVAGAHMVGRIAVNELAVQDGSGAPVAVKGEIRQRQVRAAALTGCEEHKAVEEGAVHRLSNRSPEGFLRRNGHRHRGSAMAGNGNRSVFRCTVIGNGNSVSSVVFGFLLEVPINDLLRQGRRVQGIGEGVAGQVMNRKGEAERACPIAQLRLGLCRVCALHRQIGLGAGDSLDVGQTCALLAGRVVAVFAPGHRLRRGHQHGGNQIDFLSFAERCKFRVRHNVLLCQCGQTGHMGGGHRGTAHIGVAIVQHSRVNIAAGRRDFRLQLEIQGDAPGAEIRHGQRPVLPLGLAHGDPLIPKGKELLPIGLGDEHGANVGLRNAAHIRQGLADDVIIDQDGLGALGIGVVHLLLKGQLAGVSLRNASLYQSDLAFQRGEARFGQGSVKITGAAITAVHIFQGGVQACQQGFALHRRFLVEDLCAVGGHQVIRRGDRVHTGHRQSGILRRWGGKHGAVGIGDSRQIVPGLVAKGGAVGIARSHIQNHAVALHRIVNLLELLLRAGGEARVGAQTHVDDIHAQGHRILHCRNDIGLPALAQEVVKDLHSHNLRIRRNAANRIAAVGRRNARHMGAMIQAGFGAGDGVGISVGIVIGKGELIIHPQLRSS